ncbi:MAG: glycosyltransferase family 4 protein [Planctomycetes bacterium]|nr:glycosyltransferase family 4 protein [Planctomycetota bacterium]
MHILYMENAIGFGGSTRCALDLSERCVRHGWRASLALGYPLPADHTADSSVKVIPLHETSAMRRAVKLRRFRDQSAWRAHIGFVASVMAADLPLALRLARYVVEHDVDLVHANNDLLVNRAAILAGRLTRRPVVSHQRGWVWPCATVRWLARRTERIVAISGSVADDLVAAGVGEDRVVVCYDGIDVDRFAGGLADRSRVRREWGWTDDHLVVGMPAVLTEWKGHAHFLHAFANLVDRHPMARAVLVGGPVPGEPNLHDELQRLTHRLGIHHLVHFAGHVSAMPSAYAAMDVVVHASQRPEPLGLVVLEAMAAGRAVVAARAGGPTEIITHGVNGLLVGSGDGSALAGVLARLASNPQLRESLGVGAVRRAAEFDLRDCWSRTVDVYEDVLRRVGTSHRESTPWASKRSSCC